MVHIRVQRNRRKELWIYLEGVHWIEEVYLQYDTPYIEAEIQFVSKQIKRLEEELNVHCDPIHCEDMDIIELSIYFQKAKKTIYNEINKNRKDLEKYIIGKKPIKLSEEGVRWMELNLYRKRYMKDLYLYKRVMQDRKREKTMRQKLHEDDKRKRVNVLLSNNERELLKEKMDKYGYADLSSYFTEMQGIYERLYLEDIDGKKEISELVSNMIGEIRKYLFEQNKILMKSSLTRNDIQLLSEQNDKILESNMNLVKLINEVLWVSSRVIAEDPSRFVQQAKLFDDDAK